MIPRTPSLSRCLILLFLLSGAAHLGAQSGKAPLTVAIKEAAPFTIRDSTGDWSGISFELWQRIGDSLGVDYTLVETTLPEMIDGVQAKRYDAGVAALTITADREKRFDFTHTFYTTGLSIAVSRENSGSMLSLLFGIFSIEFLEAVGALAVVLLIFGVLVWLFERRRNPEEFGGSALSGIMSGFWWSAVTMTTVGYGDKSPRTLGGRVLALVWMFMAIIIISSFTAGIASALTLNQLQGKISGPEDLSRRDIRVGTVAKSTSAAWLDRERIGYRPFTTVAEGLEAAAAGRIDAMVYDAPILKYLVKEGHPDALMVLPVTFSRQDYGIALTDGSPHRERIDQVMLSIIRQPQWQDVLHRYLGD